LVTEQVGKRLLAQQSAASTLDAMDRDK